MARGVHSNAIPRTIPSITIPVAYVQSLMEEEDASINSRVLADWIEQARNWADTPTRTSGQRRRAWQLISERVAEAPTEGNAIVISEGQVHATMGASAVAHLQPPWRSLKMDPVPRLSPASSIRRTGS